MVSTLITVAVIAWCAQLALGGWQISRFNRAFDKLSQQGRVGVGRSGGRFKPGWWLPWRWTNSSG
ncbi:DNA-binding transcriptional activator GutM [Salmonella enterica subsp. enterica]|uniref:DNA-binding transcriptional activator GutM n=1 Tax=Salmonella enterica I TaxID=59201 RepID=A0A379W465_SALET|nr:DNA-binding transcriptional activator GutM [Salmonella enterica subsp. enterica]